MANKMTYRLVNDSVRFNACRAIQTAPVGFTVTLQEETRSQEQNRLMWPLIQDMQHQIDEMKGYSADDIKLRFLHALGQEMRFLPALEGGGMFPVGQRSSTLTKAQFSALIELMFAHGARHGVQWSAKSNETLNHTTPANQAT